MDVTPIASVDFETVFTGDVTRTGIFSAEQNETLYQQVAYAKGKGIGARYWDTPGWPVGARNRVWQRLWEAAVMLINVDDLIAGAGFANGGNLWDA